MEPLSANKSSTGSAGPIDAFSDHTASMMSLSMTPNAANKTKAVKEAPFRALNRVDIAIDDAEPEVIEFPGILYGAPSGSTVTILVTESVCGAINEQYGRHKVQRVLNARSPSQDFECPLSIEKVRFGLSVEGEAKWPYNALLRCRLNVLDDEVVALEPLAVSGSINHVNGSGETWLISDVAVDAVERVQHEEDRWLSEVVALRMSNDVDRSVHHRNSSYLIHDPDAQFFQNHGIHRRRWTKGLRLQFHLKLSGRTNRRAMSPTRPRFVQCWNVQPL